MGGKEIRGGRLPPIFSCLRERSLCRRRGRGGRAFVADQAVPLVLPEKGQDGDRCDQQGHEDGAVVQTPANVFGPGRVVHQKGGRAQHEHRSAFDAGEEDHCGFEPDEGEHAKDGQANQAARPGHVEGLFAIRPDDHANDSADEPAADGDGIFHQGQGGVLPMISGVGDFPRPWPPGLYHRENSSMPL